jgi:23S rRNA (cytosine1962-C5)-methyltransferase
MDKISILENRLAKNYKKLKKWLNKASIEAFRLYEKDIPEFPYIIDIYGEHAVVFERGKKLDDSDESNEMRASNQAMISECLGRVLSIANEHIFFKSKRVINRSKDQYEKYNQKDQKLTVQEEDLKFLVNLEDYQDTGLFLDHRWLRRTIKHEVKYLHCLNLFCYTGAISMAMLKGEAKYVDSVDLSNTYLNWAQENATLNFPDQSNYSFIRSDVFEYLKQDHDYYDLIVCDPPSFSNSKKMLSEFDIQRDQVGLINLCMKNLKKSGKLYFSTNFRKFKIAPEIDDKYQVIDISKKSFDQDFHDLKSRHLFEITFKNMH